MASPASTRSSPCSTRHLGSEILVATRSQDKLDEIRAIIGRRLKLLTLDDIGIPTAAAEEEIEVFPSYIENALAKARYFAERAKTPTLADDSGLFVKALRGPGVRTKRFAIDNGYVGVDAAGKELDRANNRLLLEKMRNVSDRAAHYVCAAVYVSGNRFANAIGTCSGEIALEEKGAGGFGYDPLFFIADLGVTFAQLSPAQKNERSHRARAFRAIASHIE